LTLFYPTFTLRCGTDEVRAVEGAPPCRWTVRAYLVDSQRHHYIAALARTHTHACLTLQRSPIARDLHLGTYDTREVAAHVHDFAALTLRGVDTATNFDKGAYRGADGALLPVEAALPGLGRDEHSLVRVKLAAMMAAEAADRRPLLPQPPHQQLLQASASATSSPPPQLQQPVPPPLLLRLRQLVGRSTTWRPSSPRRGMPNQQQQQEEAASEEPSIEQAAIGHQAQAAVVKEEVQSEAPLPPHQPLPQAHLPPQAHEAHVAPPHDVHARAALAFLCGLKAAFDKGVLTEEEFKAMRAQSLADMRM
jgi:hypothetical protein